MAKSDPIEALWNGRPISLVVPAERLEVLGGEVVPLIEPIAPVHQRVYKMGLEHLVDDWVPQRLVTATGPNALPR